jgi:hypothetical protein
MKQIPEPAELKHLLKIHAALDIIFCEEDWLRYHMFDNQWDKNISLATIDNGAGDVLFIIFTEAGIIMKGFDHESFLSPHAREEFEVYPGIYDQTPHSLLKYLEDEPLEKEEVTFCIWRETGASSWEMGDVHIPNGEDDGSEFLLGAIYTTADEYIEWAECYYEQTIQKEIVKQIYSELPINEEMINCLNPERDAQNALKEISQLFD